MSVQVVSNSIARRHLLDLNGLATSGSPRWTADHLAAAIERLGYVQVDSIRTVERAHHQILFSRNHAYRPSDLPKVTEKRRLTFENWTHDAAILPIAYFPYWRHRFERERERLQSRWWRSRAPTGFSDDLDRVLAHIRDSGPALARDFEGDKPSTGWWDWHPSKTALEYLWRTGDLAIARREGFQKVYDLSERVIPAEHFEMQVDHDVFVDFACRQALLRLGTATTGEIARFFDLLRPHEVEAWLATNRNELVELSVAQHGLEAPRRAVCLPETFDQLRDLRPIPDRLRILSPFDPLVRDRARAHRLFGFHFRIEVFVPEPKRRYGYYVFPVLRRDEFIGRIDIKQERDRGVLAVRAFWPEQGMRLSKTLRAKLEVELDRVRRFTGAERTVFADDWLRDPIA